jgi:hypothetical protein
MVVVVVVGRRGGGLILRWVVEVTFFNLGDTMILFEKRKELLNRRRC